MTSNSTKLFNIQIINFANVLVKRFPEDSELKFALTGLETLRTVNPLNNVEIFTVYIYKYRDKIMDKNEDLLLNVDFVNENPSMISDENPSSAFDVMVRLKNNWNLLQPDEKDNIWKYLQVLVKLTDKCISKTIDNIKNK